MRTMRRNLRIMETRVENQRAESDQSPLLTILGIGLIIFAFGGVWFLLLRGLTALGRMLLLWHFQI